MKRSVHIREPWSFIDLNMDGMMLKERLKGKLKKIYQDDTKNRLKEETKKEIQEEAIYYEE